jgi:Sulfotransferase domain
LRGVATPPYLKVFYPLPCRVLHRIAFPVVSKWCQECANYASPVPSQARVGTRIFSAFDPQVVMGTCCPQPGEFTSLNRLLSCEVPRRIVPRGPRRCNHPARGASPTERRSTVLEVIGVGYGRTGTLSLKAALERLGFGPCYHAVEFMRHPEHQARWEPAFRGNPRWAEVFAGYRSTVDPPASSALVPR